MEETGTKNLACAHESDILVFVIMLLTTYENKPVGDWFARC